MGPRRKSPPRQLPSITIDEGLNPIGKVDMVEKTDTPFAVSVSTIGGTKELVEGLKPSDRLLVLAAKTELVFNVQSGPNRCTQLLIGSRTLGVEDYDTHLDELGIGSSSEISLVVNESYAMDNFRKYEANAAMQSRKSILDGTTKVCDSCEGIETKSDIISYWGGNHKRCRECARILVRDIGN
eukprot:TRINITY_DN66656_c0_g1_i1.p1 TRINITY_DN66656_c0_g1~~TRINITY_DN66656_c0_g1_i1.p1  ORF type:complete len:183 (-),score=0.78 TRINITY_DN66656_c0_g1_i1:142-690(-)